MISASAPGKIILFGEHAVVYGRPALAIPVTEVYATASVIPMTSDGIRVEAHDIGVDAELSTLGEHDPLAKVIRIVFTSLNIPPSPCRIKITSTIPIASGLGSGTAVSVAILRALSAYMGKPLTDEEVSALAFEVERIHHGTPSGIDNSVITYARPIVFQKATKPSESRSNRIEPLPVGRPFSLVIADTGVPAPTREAVGDVRRLWETDKNRWEKVFDEIGLIVSQAREWIVTGEWQRLGALMNANHALLQELSVSSRELDALVEAALDAGALGAKLSGGGRGGNIIALVDQGDEQKVSRNLLAEGAKRAIFTTIR